MNLPNKLTVLRVLLIPVFLLLLFLEIPNGYLWAFVVFAFASFTDWLDGYIARKQNLVTNFGKLMDPLADKLLVAAAFIAFIEKGFIGSIPVILIISREFLVTSVRLIALETGGDVIAANIWGKLKTVTQMLSICVILLLHAFSVSADVTVLTTTILIWSSALITAISGATYVFASKDLLKQ